MVTSTQGGGDVNCRDGCHVELSDNQTLVIISADKRHVVIVIPGHELASYCISQLQLVSLVSYMYKTTSNCPVTFSAIIYISTRAVDYKFGNSRLSDLFSFHSYPWHTPSTDHLVNGPLSHTPDELSRELALVSLA